jgi:hypothetical protein
MRVQRDEGVTTRSLSGSGAWISVQLTPSIRSARTGLRNRTANATPFHEFWRDSEGREGFEEDLPGGIRSERFGGTSQDWYDSYHSES